MTQVWQDHKVRVVSLNVLEQICKANSGMCHRYAVVAQSANRVTVEYSNPDEYGSEHPMRAQFPCWQESRDMIAVALTYTRITGDSWDGEGWQAFECLRDYTGDVNPNKVAVAAVSA
jgi:hypothetical protein